MDPWFGVLGFVALLVLLAMGAPIAFAMAAVGLVGFSLLSTWSAGVARFLHCGVRATRPTLFWHVFPCLF